MTLDGELQKSRQDTVLFEGVLKGTVELECDACAANYVSHIDEKVTFKITDRPHHSGGGPEDEQDYDIIEFLDGIIDINEIILSEVNAIRFDYHKCSNCN